MGKWSNRYQSDPKTTDFVDTDVFVVAKSIEQTSGVLVVGVEYTILDYQAGDDFTNVGGTNVTGTVFTATGTTPADYTYGSTLTKYESQGFTYAELKAGLGIGSRIYKGLLSQVTPIASQTSGTFTVGMIVSITTYVAGDNFSNWNLISGSENTTGAVYQVTAAAPTTWTNSSDLAYDGSPFLVSKDINNELNPFINTLGGNPTFPYQIPGAYNITLTGAFTEGKTFVTLGGNSASASAIFTTNRLDANEIELRSYNGVLSDDLLSSTSITIEIFP